MNSAPWLCKPPAAGLKYMLGYSPSQSVSADNGDLVLLGNRLFCVTQSLAGFGPSHFLDLHPWKDCLLHKWTKQNLPAVVVMALLKELIRFYKYLQICINGWNAEVINAPSLRNEAYKPINLVLESMQHKGQIGCIEADVRRSMSTCLQLWPAELPVITQLLVCSLKAVGGRVSLHEKLPSTTGSWSQNWGCLWSRMWVRNKPVKVQHPYSYKATCNLQPYLSEAGTSEV